VCNALAAIIFRVIFMHQATDFLRPELLESFGAELDALRDEVRASLGEKDVRHIRRMIRLSYAASGTGRALLHFGFDPISFVLGTGSLALGKILENMEIGHNVMHGQYDWTRDPGLQSQTYEWDIVCDGDNWRHFHNYEHHTFTNIVGLDRDIGYGVIRTDASLPWKPSHLFQPLHAVVLALMFQWGVAAHDLRPEEVLEGKATWRDLFKRSRPFLRKAGWQLAKDYVFFPAIALWNAPRVFVGNLLANGIRNLWTFTVIFCGHFPEGTQLFDVPAEGTDTRGAWYLRQTLGSANLEGGSWFHILTGHLSHQIEHHMFPDIPAARYPEMAPRVQEICARHGVPYNTGSLGAQFGSVVKRILRYSLPGPSAAIPVPA
jgi:linoleoyl-CoA desaturase